MSRLFLPTLNIVLFDARVQCRRLLSEVDPVAASAANHAHSFVFDAALDGVNGLNFQLQKSDAAGRFEWSDGFLVDALQVLTAFWLIISQCRAVLFTICLAANAHCVFQYGHWVLFDNVNFCSPSVRVAHSRCVVP